MACGQIESGRAQHTLVVGADFLSRFLDFSDRDTAPLFADGAAAAVVSRRRAAGGGSGPWCFTPTDAGSRLDPAGARQADLDAGPGDVPAAVRCLSERDREALEAADSRLDDVDLFVYHQANSRIIRAVGQRLGLTR